MPSSRALEGLPPGDLPPDMLNSWHEIDSGDPAQIAKGNRDLLQLAAQRRYLVPKP